MSFSIRPVVGQKPTSPSLLAAVLDAANGIEPSVTLTRRSRCGSATNPAVAIMIPRLLIFTRTSLSLNRPSDELEKPSMQPRQRLSAGVHGTNNDALQSTC